MKYFTTPHTAASLWFEPVYDLVNFYIFIFIENDYWNTHKTHLMFYRWQDYTNNLNHSSALHQ